VFCLLRAEIHFVYQNNSNPSLTVLQTCHPASHIVFVELCTVVFSDVDILSGQHLAEHGCNAGFSCSGWAVQQDFARPRFSGSELLGKAKQFFRDGDCWPNQVAGFSRFKTVRVCA